MNEVQAIREFFNGGKRWWQGGMYNDARSKFCIIGAVDELAAEITFPIVGNQSVIGVIEKVAIEQFPKRCEVGPDGDSRSPLVTFNDHDETTWPDLDTVLDKAAVRWAELVG